MKITAACAVARLEQRRRAFARQQRRRHRGVDDPAHQRGVAVRRASRETRRWPPPACAPCAARVPPDPAARPSDSKIASASVEITCRAASARRQRPASLPEFEIAEAGLVSLAEQLEHADALRRGRDTPRSLVRLARARGRAGAGTRPTCLLMPAAGSTAAGCRRAASPLRRRGPTRAALRRRSAPPAVAYAGGASSARAISVGDRQRLRRVAAAQRQPRLEHLHRPLIPAARLSP